MYTVMISAGTPVDYSRKENWDGLHATYAEALELAQQAERNAGWTAKVIRVSETDAAHWHETVQQRLERERSELRESFRARISYR